MLWNDAPQHERACQRLASMGGSVSKKLWITIPRCNATPFRCQVTSSSKPLPRTHWPIPDPPLRLPLSPLPPSLDTYTLAHATMVVVLDRIYVATLILFVACCAVNVRIALERPRLLRQMPGYLHVLACIISGVGGLIMAANEIFAWELCQQLHFGCASAHVGKIINHIIKYAV